MEIPNHRRFRVNMLTVMCPFQGRWMADDVHSDRVKTLRYYILPFQGIHGPRRGHINQTRGLPLGTMVHKQKNAPERGS